VFAFGGIAGDKPVVGDWNNTGTAKVGVFRGGFFWVLDQTGAAPSGAIITYSAFSYGGLAGDIPVVGRWR
jgi:hypothetical protein